MTLTPIDIQGKTFKSGGMGYSKADVDSFFSTLSKDYETLYTENLSLKEKLNNLNTELDHYKEIEKSLQKALVLAQTTAEETLLSAKKNATVIEQEAVLKAQTIVADSKVEVDRLNGTIAELIQQFDSYKARYRALASSQLELLTSEAFNMENVVIKNMASIEKSASEHVAQLDAAPVYNTGSTNSTVATGEQDETGSETEEDFDETLSSDESMIKDFSEIFDSEEEA